MLHGGAHQRIARAAAACRAVHHDVLDPRLAPRRRIVPRQHQHPDDAFPGHSGQQRPGFASGHTPQHLAGGRAQPRRKLRHQPRERLFERIRDLGYPSYLNRHNIRFSGKVNLFFTTAPPITLAGVRRAAIYSTKLIFSSESLGHVSKKDYFCVASVPETPRKGAGIKRECREIRQQFPLL